MKVIFFVVLCFAAVFAAEEYLSPDCANAGPTYVGWKCGLLYDPDCWYCDQEVVVQDPAHEVDCDNKIGVMGMASYWSKTNTSYWDSTVGKPRCQDNTCDSIIDLLDDAYTRAIVLSHCQDLIYYHVVMDGETVPSKTEWDSRMDPEDHDHKNQTCYGTPTWCSGCCGGAQQQEAYIMKEWSPKFVNGTGVCSDRVHLMACSKKFPGCGDADPNWAREMCSGFRYQCLSGEDRTTFDCDEWLGAGVAIIPSVILAVAAMLF
jgi:hypothetical protein